MARPHAVMLPFPTPGHINPLLNLAKLLHARGFYITVVLTEYTHHCLVKAGAQDFLDGLPDFKFRTLPDGLPLSGREASMEYFKELSLSLRGYFVPVLRDFLVSLNADPAVPPVTCVVGGLMSSPLKAARELGIPTILFWTTSACGFLQNFQFGELIKRGYIPLKDESCLDTQIDWMPGMRGIRLRDLSTFVRTTDADDVFLNFDKDESEGGFKAWGVILNTCDELEHDVVAELKGVFPRLYTLGSLSELAKHIPPSPAKSIRLSVWKEDAGSLAWLDGRPAGSVLYVSFGSITVLTAHQLIEFAFGLANSGQSFLWVIRPDLVVGESAVLPEEFHEETKGRSFITSWCPQEEVLAHPSIGGFLTHGGWNSMLETLYRGIPMLCWPFFADQPTNCYFACKVWRVAMEICGDVDRVKIEGLVRELMEGEKGKEMRLNAIKWKQSAEEAMKDGGSSRINLEKLVHDMVSEKV